MTQAAPIVQPGPPEGLDDRVRRWLYLAIVVSLVGLYVVWWMTYAGLHLPPERFEQQPPGAVVMSQGAEFTLISLTQTTDLLDRQGELNPAPADAVWVVARLDVTPRIKNDLLSCTVVLVAEGQRSWERNGDYVSRPIDRCVPDDAVIGQTYPIEADFTVPITDVDRIVGVGVSQFNGSRDPLLTPPR